MYYKEYQNKYDYYFSTMKEVSYEKMAAMNEDNYKNYIFQLLKKHRFGGAFFMIV